MIRFHFLTGDTNFFDYGGKWISNKQSNGEFDYWFVIELINWQDSCGRDAPKEKYNICLSVVSPQEAGEENIAKAMSDYGQDFLQTIKDEFKQEFIVEALHSYGIAAPIWNENGNNFKQLMKQIKAKARESEFLFGFAMDRPCNAIGSTGWDFLRGDIMAGLSKSPITPEKKIILKMYGQSVD
jgi:hypothetical protein